MFARFVSRRFTASSASALTKRRRFYKVVDVVEEGTSDSKVFKVALDGRMLKTQGGNVLKFFASSSFEYTEDS
ncbi:hypothetical protein TELCIR_12573 [Teladorsagia circumcincta]|uniref:Uncharacterized protein n=1 Tax=Teladorsagia circumcincta TaxID=45464 RepID=A0A2G9U642_TELCI|nr:hypothetical protein TELCIR_12573 [Teladorsagia circumcincta]